MFMVDPFPTYSRQCPLNGHGRQTQGHHLISTILVENAALVRVLFWVAIAVTVTLGWFLYGAGRLRWLAVLGSVGLAGALALTVSPSDNRALQFCSVDFSVPFGGLDTLANIAMMVPLTLFTALAVRRPLPVFAAVAGLSALIELVQALFPALGRSCDTDDWLMNVIGAAIGALAAIAIISFTMRRTRRVPVSQTDDVRG
jgi:hypothetical protein